MDNNKHILKVGGCSLKATGCGKGCAQKLHVYDWLSVDREASTINELVEVQFKNTRKGYFRNTNNISIFKGDVVAVESSPGHDVGVVTLIGRLVELQMKKHRLDPKTCEIKKIYRKVKPGDIEKYEEAKALEHETMLKARKIAEQLKLNMKIGDVEYQGDGNKAIFYYIADEWVDFRQLIKNLADEFHVRIEMKQIGSRQEAGLIGGIGSCGRELCCSSWMTNFVSVSTLAARYQDLPLNPQKLAGQCAKLKCCLNFELDSYVDAQKAFPQSGINLETKDSTYFHFKSDILRGVMIYTTARGVAANMVTLTTTQVREIILLNKQGVKPIALSEEKAVVEVKSLDFENVVGQDDLTRFDQQKKPRKRPNNRTRKPNAAVGGAAPGTEPQKETPQKEAPLKETPQKETPKVAPNPNRNRPAARKRPNNANKPKSNPPENE